MIICKVTKKQGFILSLKDKTLEKPQWEGVPFKPPAVLGIIIFGKLLKYFQLIGKLILF